MPRSNRRSRGAGGPDEFSLESLLTGWRRTEYRRGAAWNVQPVPEAKALKVYTCPGCEGEILPGTAHLVAWRADGVLGDGADLAGRRHWHVYCWKVG